MARDIFQTTVTREVGGFLEPLQDMEVHVFVAGTSQSTYATIYGSSSGGSVSNPVITTSTGFAQFYANAGEYDIRIEDTEAVPRVSTRSFIWSALPAAIDAIPSTFLEDVDKADLAAAVQQAMYDVGDLKTTARSYTVGTEPTGWLICDGREATPSYPALRAALIADGSPYGTANGNPRIPDYQGRVLVGKGTHAEVDSLADNDGLAVGSRKIKHKHSRGTFAVTDTGHTHTQGSEGYLGSGSGFSSPANVAVTGLSYGVGQAAQVRNSTGNASAVNTYSGEIGDTTGPSEGPAYQVGIIMIKT